MVSHDHEGTKSVKIINFHESFHEIQKVQRQVYDGNHEIWAGE